LHASFDEQPRRSGDRIRELALIALAPAVVRELGSARRQAAVRATR
jgi:hypothetical protein